ncbi:MAG: hypothetical protein U0414_02875 [Polyangiaceae bacterium]
MLSRLVPALPLIAAMTAIPAVASAADCAPATAGASIAELPRAWRAAVDELQAATSQPNKPWSCAGGVIDLELKPAGGGTLIIHTASGESVSRGVDSPEDVAPLGEAILSRPMPAIEPAPAVVEPAPPPAPVAPAAPAPKQKSPPSTEKAPDAPAPTEERADPRVIVSAQLAPRYAGKSNVVMGSAEVGVGVPIKAWVPALWVRFDGPLSRADKRDVEFVEACVGGAFGHAFAAGPVDITPSLTGSAAIMVEDDEPDRHGETHVDARVGANVRVALPRKSLFRAAFSADFEIAPNQFDDDHHGNPPAGIRTVHLPSYTLGLGVGVELAPR